MTEERRTVEVPGRGAVSAVLSASTGGAWLFVYAHGAGANLDDPFALHAAGVLPPRGIGVLRFQFLYRERGRSAPDPNGVLEDTWRAVLAAARQLAAPRGLRVVAGGRSMGGRIASQVVAAGEAVDALALFAYPLHPPGRPQQRRVEHLALVQVPTLFCSGTRDDFATPDELRDAVSLVAGSSLHLLDSADHGFSPLKSTGRSRRDVWDEACDALAAFLSGLEA
ncbi:MAG TPA: alpha/beta family hydrolase [Dehalococcoidia bacterium]|nr:alpha/beta family hydrolase [Dehalococcoidia bacterium]